MNTKLNSNKQLHNLDITIIIPVYNEEDKIKDCMLSLLAETSKNIQFICIDDGSTDNTFSTLLECARNDNRIFILEQVNQGLQTAIKVGLNYALGDAVYIVDEIKSYCNLEELRCIS